MYSEDALERIKRIEMLKREKYTLEEIKEILDRLDKVSGEEHFSGKITSLQAHMKQLEKELKEIHPYIEKLKPNQAKNVFKVLTPQSAACIEAILLLLGKGPLM
ncbi:hypothetical protein MALU111345_08900 [Marinicrinis lubricantis]